jgi:hypothetical protein
MSAKNENASILGVGVAVCAACCAGPILGVLAAIGLGTAAGFALFGSIVILVGAGVMAIVVIRHRRHGQAGASSESSVPVPVELTNMRSRR